MLEVLDVLVTALKSGNFHFNALISTSSQTTNMEVRIFWLVLSSDLPQRTYIMCTK